MPLVSSSFYSCWSMWKSPCSSFFFLSLISNWAFRKEQNSSLITLIKHFVLGSPRIKNWTHNSPFISQVSRENGVWRLQFPRRLSCLSRWISIQHSFGKTSDDLQFCKLFWLIMKFRAEETTKQFMGMSFSLDVWTPWINSFVCLLCLWTTKGCLRKSRTH